MDFDDDDLDDEPSGPLLPPEDRLWRHPSEVATSPLPKPVAPREPRLLTVVALTSSISVLLTLGVVAVVRPVRTILAVEQVAAPADPAKTAAHAASDVAGIASRLRATILRVSARGPAGERYGSGVVYRSDGMLLTTHHIVEGSESVEVTLDDGRLLPARVVGSDPETDIALLDVEGDDFVVAPLGTTLGLKVGEPAITIGTPGAGAGPVVTLGVVSATGQAVSAGGLRMVDMIQTDAAVADGCAGGAVADGAGVVFGIATVNVAHEGGATGYATPIDIARLVAGQLLTHGRVTRGWLGVEGGDLSDSRARQLGVEGGVVVKGVMDASPAARIGLTASDVITAVDGRGLASMIDLVVELRMRRPGDTVVLDVLHGADRRSIRATLAEKP